MDLVFSSKMEGVRDLFENRHTVREKLIVSWISYVTANDEHRIRKKTQKTE
jgi:hypothetical protein